MSFPVSSWLRLSALALLLPVVGAAQNAAPALPAVPAQQWYLLDPKADGVMGVSVRKTYDELLRNRPSAPVVVAIIDAGIDTAHADLKRLLWTNPKEVAGNGLDDDQNGYADDVHGWNFLGGADGRNVDVETYEDTRLIARLKPLYEGKARTAVPAAKRAEYDLYQKVKKTQADKVAENTERAESLGKAYLLNKEGADNLKLALNLPRLDTASLRRVSPADPNLYRAALGLYGNLREAGYADMESVLADMKEGLDQSKSLLDFSLNPAFNPRASIIGDNPEDTKDRRYGNRDNHGPDPSHGTHVAGIIGADRTNNQGILGIADNVRLMAIRAVPNGDERDKDIANAIRYAVDNGASIINMSFGKYYSPQREAVEEAMKYAASKGVLLVHSAGNESQDIDVQVQYPSPLYLSGQRIPNLITVGAAARTNDRNMVADFSNYGKKNVDVFAPGHQIYSTLPGQQYGNKSGTSMASPVVAGMAAVLKSYFPSLSATDLKRLILASVDVYHTKVLKPGTQKEVDFAELSNTGGLVNLYRAVQMASAEAAK
ncbi:S8 family peptidase [Hymenobacter psychrotolerans]|uniref:Subtilase family protein n=1 Tax=Hymenobacter psychrotolerans DSM 18569 TaxID=1121959 RepID=A0A1M7AXY5_9BACT|nr:S8 family peptidase [Hymenobacter psychrotolerans]SHL47592.1 Subtilase family protein [Hymenobacter psychrotolerans DSM 18569]